MDASLPNLIYFEMVVKNEKVSKKSINLPLKIVCLNIFPLMPNSEEYAMREDHIAFLAS